MKLEQYSILSIDPTHDWKPARLEDPMTDLEIDLAQLLQGLLPGAGKHLIVVKIEVEVLAQKLKPKLEVVPESTSESEAA
ncbi:MAG: hypothetical protein MUC48_21265 [Leptolyngbya sp. Prado105]|nr:hypothetical protein [Leptolyngbya sp. Prado105]